MMSGRSTKHTIQTIYGLNSPLYRLRLKWQPNGNGSCRTATAIIYSTARPGMQRYVPPMQKWPASHSRLQTRSGQNSILLTDGAAAVPWSRYANPSIRLQTTKRPWQGGNQLWKLTKRECSGSMQAWNKRRCPTIIHTPSSAVRIAI